MKSINIKVLRTFKNNFSLFSGTILLSMLIALFVTACLSVGSTITDTVQGIMDGQNIESCEFVLLNDLDNPEKSNRNSMRRLMTFSIMTMKMGIRPSVFLKKIPKWTSPMSQMATIFPMKMKS